MLTHLGPKAKVSAQTCSSMPTPLKSPWVHGGCSHKSHTSPNYRNSQTGLHHLATDSCQSLSSPSGPVGLCQMPMVDTVWSAWLPKPSQYT